MSDVPGMTRDEWCHLAAHRTPVLVAMEGIPDAPATLIGWHKDRWARVQFTSGKRADVRPERVRFDSEHLSVRGTIRGTNNEDPVSACDAPGPLDANKERRNG